MTSTFESYLESVMTNQQAEYLSQRSFNSIVIVQKQTHTHRTDCSTWITKWPVERHPGNKDIRSKVYVHDKCVVDERWR